MAVVAAAAVCWLCCRGIGSSGLLRAAGDVAFFSAMLALPEGAVTYVTSRVYSAEDDDESVTHASLLPQTADASSEAPGASDVSSLPAVSQPSETPPEGVETGKVKTVTLSNSEIGRAHV